MVSASHLRCEGCGFDPHRKHFSITGLQGGGAKKAMSGFEYFGWHVTAVSGAVLFIVGIFALLTVVRMFYTSHPKAPRYVPESTFLVFLGIGLGIIISAISSTEATYLENLFKFSHDIFLFLLVPIIIFESAYTLDKTSFFHNFTEIMVYAVVGTLMNTLFIAFLLNFLKRYFVIQLYTTSQIFAFAALISAVDPVSVMAVMIDLKVNRNLYNMSFGESVLNDGVSIVLYSLFSNLDQLQQHHYNTLQIVGIGILKFIVSVTFAILVGASITFLACIILKYKKNKLRYLEPFLALICAYGTFQLADSLLFSGIISIIISGLLLSRYSEPNWAHSSVEAMHVVMKMFASSFEALIFFDMGMQISFLTRDKIIGKSKIDYIFLLTALGLVLVARVLSVLLLTALLNIRRKMRNEAIPLKEQFIMIMAGLRGAISFALSTALVTIPEGTTGTDLSNAINVQNNIIFVTSIIILFTIVIQGLPLGFFIKKLYIAREREYPSNTPLDGHRIDLSILTMDLVFQQTLLSIDAIGWNKGLINSWDRFVQKFDGALQKAFLRKKITNEGEIMKKLMIIAEEEDKMERDMKKEVDDLLLRKRKDALNEIQSLLAAGEEERAREVLAELPPGERHLLAQKLNLEIAAPDALDRQRNMLSMRFLGEFNQKALVSSESRKSFANLRLSMDVPRLPGAPMMAGIDGMAPDGVLGMATGHVHHVDAMSGASLPPMSPPINKDTTDTSSDDSLIKYLPKSQSRAILGADNRVLSKSSLSMASFSPEKVGLIDAQPRVSIDAQAPPSAKSSAPAPSPLTIGALLGQRQGANQKNDPAEDARNSMGIVKDRITSAIPTVSSSKQGAATSEVDTLFFSPQATFGDGNLEDSESGDSTTKTGGGVDV